MTTEFDLPSPDSQLPEKPKVDRYKVDQIKHLLDNFRGNRPEINPDQLSEFLSQFDKCEIGQDGTSFTLEQRNLASNFLLNVRNLIHRPDHHQLVLTLTRSPDRTKRDSPPVENYYLNDIQLIHFSPLSGLSFTQPDIGDQSVKVITVESDASFTLEQIQFQIPPQPNG